MQLRTLFIALMVITLTSGVALAADVTFQVYMSWQETIGNFDAEGGDMIVLRGDFNEWSGNDFALELDEEGENSLYTGTFDLEADSASYKFAIIPAEGDDMYEGGDNRMVVVGEDAITLDPVWFGGAEPVELTEVTFQVYMAFQEESGKFTPDSGDALVLRGTMNEWSGTDQTLMMVEEGENGLYAGTWDIPVGDHQYKFAIVPGMGDDVWENVDNRVLEVGDDPMTLDPVWFNNQEPVELTMAEVLLQVDMSIAIQIDVFDPANDAVVVRGGNAAFGDWGGFTALERVGATDTYAGWFELGSVPIGTAIPYKFVIDNDNDQEDPITWEELPEGGNREITPTGEEEDSDENGFGEIITDVVFWANNPGGIESDVTVNFMLETRPAWYKFADVGIDGVESIDGFYIAGLGEVIGWNWGGLPAEAELMDDGEGADGTAGDSIYTVSIMFPEGTAINQIYKYGINMLDNEAGFGKNHVLELSDENAEMNVYDVFGSNDSLYDDYWSVRELESNTLPVAHSLAQNFPNPFNPVTSIAFDVAKQSEVTLNVYNLSGRLVSNFNPGVLNAGHYEFTFEAHNLPAGTYIYQLNAGEFTATRKMTLLK